MNNNLTNKHSQNLNQYVHTLLKKVGSNQISSSAYDTSWVARLSKLDSSLGINALNWLRNNQLPDGSWGAEAPVYFHERAICTLSAIISLAKYGDHEDKRRLELGLEALEHAINHLEDDLMGYTIGFELIFPTLLAEAEELGILQFEKYGLLKKLMQERDKKLAKLPARINRHMTVAFSAEMVGEDQLHLLNLEKLQQTNGSVSYSPSATAFFLLNIRPDNLKAINYLENIAVNGAVPYVTPIEIFEYAWALWNLSLLDSLDNEVVNLCQSHLDKLEAEWRPGIGIAACIGLTLPDGDDTSMVYKVLSHYDRPVDHEAVLNFEGPEQIYCFEYEADPSLSTNIHALAALRQANLPVQNSSVQKVIKFLRKAKGGQPYWIDKWHASPYYPTSHAIIACSGYCDEIIEESINWILSTQNSDGSWGHYMPTAEESSYCLQALFSHSKQGGNVPKDVLDLGIKWLQENWTMKKPPLWIGKSLYCPELVVDSAILSALMLGEEAKNLTLLD